MVWAAAFVIVVAIIIISHVVVREQTNHKNNKEKKRLLVAPAPAPPGPRGLPIIGHLHLIGKTPHKDFQRLSRVHGPIMLLRLGTVDTVVASSPQAAELFLRTHDLNFATRPPMRIVDSLTYGKKDVIFARYGPVWREMRKLYVVELLSTQKVSSFEALRRQELGLLLESTRDSAARGEAVDLSARVAAMSVNATCRMLFGKKYEDGDIGGGGGGKDGFTAVIDELTHLVGASNLGDYFPILSRLDVQGLTRRAKLAKRLVDQFFERVLEEHENKSQRDDDSNDVTSEGEDFVDIILEKIKNNKTSFHFTREHIKCMMLDTLVAAMDTTAVSIVWAMSELIKNPATMRKVKEEIKREVGLERMVEEKDLGRLKYLEMVIKESFRLHPIGPILLPRAAVQECTVGGFRVPKNTTVLINVWAITRDPDVWSDPERFFPERFKGSSVDYRGQHYELLPFGSGRRSCPGTQLGMATVLLVVAQLAHCFDWDLPDGALPQHLDMTEEFGLVTNRAHHLVAVPTRLI